MTIDAAPFIKAVEVVEKASNVFVNRYHLRRLANYIDGKELPHWLSISPFPYQDLAEHDQLRFVFALDAMSFCYWEEPKWTVNYKGETYDGAQGLMAAVGRAIEQGRPMLMQEEWEHMNMRKLQWMLGDEEDPVPVSRVEDRTNSLRIAAWALRRNYEGSIVQMLEKNEFNAEWLVQDLVTNFGFQDQEWYRGKLVQFNKRATLLANDINEGITGRFDLTNTEKLSACADYKLPQVLRRHEVLKYGAELEAQIRAKKPISKGHPMEVEIRAATMYAVDLLTEEVQRTNKNATTRGVNDWLWLEGQKKVPGDELYHRTLTMSY